MGAVIENFDEIRDTAVKWFKKNFRARCLVPYGKEGSFEEWEGWMVTDEYGKVYSSLRIYNRNWFEFAVYKNAQGFMGFDIDVNKLEVLMPMFRKYTDEISNILNDGFGVEIRKTIYEGILQYMAVTTRE